MTLQEKASLLINDEFKSKIRMAALKAAKDLINDTNIDMLVRKYALRVRNNIFGDWLNHLTFLVVEHEQTTATVDDALLQNIVNSVFTQAAEQYYYNM